MIPYVNFKDNNSFTKLPNPFEDSSIPMIVFLDEDTVKDSSRINLLISQLDEQHLKVVSNSKIRHQHVNYLDERKGFLMFDEVDILKERVVHHGLEIDNIRKTFDSSSFSNWGSTDELIRAAVASRTAEAIHAHIIITSDPVLLEHADKGILNKVLPLNSQDGLALIGLLLRSRGKYKTLTEKTDSYTNIFNHTKWLFFWSAARDYIPGGWKLVSATQQLNESNASELSLTLMARASNVLKCRDEIHKNLLITQTNSSVDEALFYFEYYLINIAALFDVIARVVDEIYRPVDRRNRRIGNRSWRGHWLAQLISTAPEFESLMQLGSFNRDVLEFTATLRNYIHAEGLNGSSHSKNGKTAPILIDLPRSEVPNLKPIVLRLWGDAFGRDYILDDMMMLEVGVIVERLTPYAITVINNIIEVIDYNAITDYNESIVQTEEPADWYAKGHMDQIKGLIGLEELRAPEY